MDTTDNILGTLGNRFKTDKIYEHGYHRFYHDVLHHLCDKSFNMMEIGVAGFNSIDMWKTYFPLAKIYGIDINSQYSDERLCIFKCDQSNEKQLRNVLSQIGNTKCDFINDDGSHIPEHQILTFDLFFNDLLNDGGVYIIEDIETSYWKRKGLYGYTTEYGYGHQNSIVEKFKHVVDILNAKYLSQEDKKSLLDKVSFLSLSTLSSISSITFAQNCIIIKKKHQYEYKYSNGPYRFSDRV
jgi:hypothetical protein